MLHCAVVFFIIAIVAAVLGFRPLLYWARGDQLSARGRCAVRFMWLTEFLVWRLRARRAAALQVPGCQLDTRVFGNRFGA
jgi:hypothetical protein